MQWFLKSVAMISLSLERVSPEIQLNCPGPDPLLPRERTKLPLGRKIWIRPLPLSPTRMNPESSINKNKIRNKIVKDNSIKFKNFQGNEPWSSTARHSGCWNWPRWVPRKPKTTNSSPLEPNTLILQLPKSQTAIRDPSGETLKKIHQSPNKWL